MITFCPLASGSKGNCLYLGTPDARILIDVGLSAKITLQRLAEIGVSYQDIDAIFISHEHGDHIQGLPGLLKLKDVPVITNSGTAKALAHELDISPRFKLFTTDEPFHFQGLDVLPFSIQHDTVDPVAFTFEIKGVKIGVCTDLGFATTLVEHHLRGAHMLYLESNHEPAMVHASSRPPVYKQRVLSRSGHLSNEEASLLVSRLLHEGLTKLYLAHLSSECNSPEKALSTLHHTLQSRIQNLQVSIAYQDKLSEVFHVTA